jgi:hypothetical protein
MTIDPPAIPDFIVGITGSRYWSDFQFVYQLLRRFPEHAQLVHGNAEGADACAERAWNELDRANIKRFQANWRLLGNRAGPMRNHQMVGYTRMCREAGATVRWIALRHPLSHAGTDNCLGLIRRAGFEPLVLGYPEHIRPGFFEADLKPQGVLFP